MSQTSTEAQENAAMPQASEKLAAAVRPWVAATVVTTIIIALVYAFASLGTRVSWFKTLHVIAVISWFAGIFYLPRLFVYHATVPADDVIGHERFGFMERKPYRFVTPFFVMTFAFGTAMLVEYGMLYVRTNAWLHVKLTLVLLIAGYHLWLGYHGRALRLGRRTRDHKFYRVVNELPVLVLFAIVGLVILKPF